jgi:hypothetical protein
MTVLARLLSRPPVRGSIVVDVVNGRPRVYLAPVYSERLRTLIGEATPGLRGGSRLWARNLELRREVRP